MLKEKLKTLIEEAIVHMKIKPINKNEMKYAKEKIDYVTRFIDDSNDMKKASAEFPTLQELKNANVSEGDIVTTRGYYTEGDGGAATYKIMTHDEWLLSIPVRNRVIGIHLNRVGTAPILYPNQTDGYVHHKLNNGLIAKLLSDGTYKVEQMGLFEGRNDNTDALIHIFGNIHSGRIEFGQDKHYIMGFRKYNIGYSRFNEFGIKDVVVKPEQCVMNEYSPMNGCRKSYKPSIGFAEGLQLIGNNCTLETLPNTFIEAGHGGDFATIELGGTINGLEITGFNFKPNGLKQYKYGNDTDGYTSMVTTNHTISYFSTEFTGIIPTDCQNKYNIPADIFKFESTLNDLNIHHNNFYDNGTSVDISDCGGDFVLIINPLKSRNVFIEDNYMENWGRWAFAVDLGGNGERFYNYKFNRNRCIQDFRNKCRENNDGAYRGLGFIDFEARKCWTGLECCDNYVYGLDGWAFNGNGRVSTNITIKNNTFIRPDRQYRSSYPYGIEFYSGHIKDVLVENNIFRGGGGKWGLSAHNFTYRGNTSTAFQTLKDIYGDIIIEDNYGIPIFNSPGIPVYIKNPNNEFYVEPSQYKTNISIKRSTGELRGNFFDPLDPNKFKHIHLDVNGDNKFTKVDMNIFGLDGVTFDPSQVMFDITYALRGAKFTGPSYSRPSNIPVAGGGIYEVGDIVTNTLDYVRRVPDGYTCYTFLNKNKDGKTSLRCTKAGYCPTVGEFQRIDGDETSLYSPTGSTNVTKGRFYCTEDNYYYCKTGGSVNGLKPTHTSGTARVGKAEFIYVAPIANFEYVDEAFTEVSGNTKISKVNYVTEPEVLDQIINVTINEFGDSLPLSAIDYNWKVTKGDPSGVTLTINSNFISRKRNIDIQINKYGEYAVTATGATGKTYTEEFKLEPPTMETINGLIYNECHFLKLNCSNITTLGTSSTFNNETENDYTGNNDEIDNNGKITFYNCTLTNDGGILFSKEKKSYAVIQSNDGYNPLKYFRYAGRQFTVSLMVQFPEETMKSTQMILTDKITTSNKDDSANTYIYLDGASNKWQIIGSDSYSHTCPMVKMPRLLTFVSYGDTWTHKYLNETPLNNTRTNLFIPSDLSSSKGELYLGGNPLTNQYSDMILYGIDIQEASLNANNIKGNYMNFRLEHRGY